MRASKTGKQLDSELAKRGIHLPVKFEDATTLSKQSGSMVAFDMAGGTFNTTPNTTIPAHHVLAQYEPIIRILKAPLENEKIFGSIRIVGDFGDDHIEYRVVEDVGTVTAYTDASYGGLSSVNINSILIDTFVGKTHTVAGRREVIREAKRRISIVTEKSTAAANNISRFQDQSYAVGIAGRNTWGTTNHPDLPAAIQPTAKVAGGVAWFTPLEAPNATGAEVYADIIKLFQQLRTQAGGIVDALSKTILIVPLSKMKGLDLMVNTNGVVQSVTSAIAMTYPNMVIRQSRNYDDLVQGSLMQLIYDEIAPTASVKPVELLSNVRYQESPVEIRGDEEIRISYGGTGGAGVNYPVMIASMDDI